MRTTLRLGVAIAVLALSTVFGAAVAQAAPPANNNFADAIALEDDDVTPGSNVDATVENPAEQAVYPGWGLFNSAWYSFVPASDGRLTVAVCSNFATNLLVLEGTSLETLVLAQNSPGSLAQGLASSSCTGGTYPSSTYADVTEGDEIRIHLGSAFSGSTGTFNITASFLPELVNDDFEDATALSSGELTPGANFDKDGSATEQIDETEGGQGDTVSKGVWFKIAVPSSGDLTVGTCSGVEFDGVVDVFTGSAVDALTLIGSADSSPCSAVEVEIALAQDIYVRVSGTAGATGKFSILASFSATDSDSDGVSDEMDDCPNDAQGVGKTNGCPLEDVVISAPPTISGTAQVGSTLTLSLGSAVNSPELDPSIAAPTSGTIYWYSCSSANDLINCLVRPETSSSYVPVTADIGRFIRAEVEWSNNDGSVDSTPSVATALVAAAPVVQPPAANPPAPTDPLTLAVNKTLGTVKRDKKGVFTFKGAVIACGASATGPCTGTFAITAKVGKKTVKYGVGKTGQAAGKSAAVTFKPSSKLAKAIKKAKGKKLKVTLVFSVSAPGFAPQTATTTATLR